MKHYSKEKKEILKLETELAMINLSRCLTFVLGLGANDQAYYEFEQLAQEYSILKDVREDTIYSMGCDEDLAVCDADYLIIKKWGWLNLQTFKSLSSNIER